MAYSVQMYKSYIDKSPTDILKQLEAEKRTRQNRLGEITNTSYTDGEDLVRFSLFVTIRDNQYKCDVTINQSQNLLLIQAPTETRQKIKQFLAEVVENRKPSEIIHDINLDFNQSLDLFKRITKEDEDNIIETLTIYFEPEFGHMYRKETYTEISYKFTRNRCATKHRDFEPYAQSVIPHNSRSRPGICRPN